MLPEKKGYYEHQGLDVDIKEGGFSINTIEEVVSSRAQFGVTNSEILISILCVFLYKFNIRLNREIKEKNESRDALVQSEARLTAMFEDIHSAVAIYSVVDQGRDFIIKGLNKAALCIENISRDQALGKPVIQVFPGIKKSGLFDVFKRVYNL